MADKPKTTARKRGRPRTLTDDQEVQERRRKQLRLAQQAYRERKETTFGNIQSRVHELENGIEDLSQSFLSFSNLLLENDLLSRYPHIASSLQKITQQFVSLAKARSDKPTKGALVSATKPPQAEMSAAPDISTDQSSVPEIAGSDTPTDVEDVFPSAAINSPGRSTPPNQDQSIPPFGIAMPTPTVHPPYLIPPSLNSLSSSQDVLPCNLNPDPQFSFAQRLVKACCQNGYRLLIDAPNDDRVQHIFGSIPSVSDRNCLISRVYPGIQDKIGTFLDLKVSVLTGLRANMHIFSEAQLPLSSRAWQIAADTGEWLDASEVQSYLRDKKVVLDYFSASSGRLEYTVSSSLDMTAFIKFLSTEPICIGIGPAFSRQSVEKALRLATLGYRGEHFQK